MNNNYKFYLDADIEERARRRYNQNIEKGITDETYEQVLENIKQRHILETTREINPLRKADDAIVIQKAYAGLIDISELPLKI